MGEPSRRAQGRHRRRGRSADGGVLRPESRGSARAPGESRGKGNDDAVMVRGEGGRNVSDPRSRWSHGDSDARQLPARKRGRDARLEQDGVHLRQMGGLEQSAIQDRGVVLRHNRRAPEWHGRSQPHCEGDGDRPDIRRHARAGECAEGWKVRNAMKTSMLLITLSLLVAPMAAAQAPAQGGRGGGAPAGDPAAAPTPRLANGKPDLTGSWAGGGWSFTGAGAPGATVGGMFRRCTPFQSKQCMEWTNQSEDWPFMSTARLDMRVPIYKPEHWDKMIEMDQWTNRDDPVMTCLPLGIPRQGPPARIFATDTDITFIYRAGVDGAGGNVTSVSVAKIRAGGP